MIDLTKRNNYVDGQYIDVDDFQTEQNYFIEKIRDLSSGVAGNGLTSLKGLQVVINPVMTQSVPDSSVSVAIDKSPDPTAPNPQNFTNIPSVLNSSATDFYCYSVFQALTSNLQRVDLKITLAQALNTEDLSLIIRIKQLIDGTNPLSPLANTPALYELQLNQNQIPLPDSSEFLILDLSNENSGQGLSLVSNLNYAIELQFRRPLNSTSNLRLFHSPLNTLNSLNSNYFSFVLINNKYAQSFTDADGIQQQFLLYYKLYTSAVEIQPGEAIINGQRVVVEQDQFSLLEIPDRRNLDSNGNVVFNYVVLSYQATYTDPQLVQGTRNTINTRIQDSSLVQVLTQPEWDQLASDPNNLINYLLLAVVTDSNIVSFLNSANFQVPSNATNLTFHDWLNPSNTSPSTEAIQIQQGRPSDFIFFVANVPSQVPLTDSMGNIQREPATVLDQFGNVLKRQGDPVLDNVVRVVVNVTSANGKNTKTLELAQVSEIGTTVKFRNYSGTISNISDNPFDNVFSYTYGTDQIAPNVTYNFVAYTTRGLPVYIQDYNRTIVNTNADLVRGQTFPVFLQKGSRTVVINQDLQLGSFNPASDQSQPGVTQFVPTLEQNEQMIAVGTAQLEAIADTLTLLGPASSFTFESPMAFGDGTKITNSDLDVSLAYSEGYLSILVDLNDGKGPVDITFSGSHNRDVGGNGTTVLVSGTLDNALALDSSATWEVKVRNTDGKDNTNQSKSYLPVGPASVGGSSDVRVFQLIARGVNTTISPLNTAGFNNGEQVYVYINDRQALDQNFQPISFTFNSAVATITLPTVYHLGEQQYFREKSVKSIQNSSTATPGTVLLDTGLDYDGYAKSYAQLIFNNAEIPTSINAATKVYIRYNKVTITPQNINYYKAQFSHHGTRNGLPITNDNVVSLSSGYISVPEAIALTTAVSSSSALDPSTFQSTVFFVDGINITSLLCPIGTKTVVADNGVALTPGEVAYNPEQGTLKFYKYVDGYGNVASEGDALIKGNHSLSASYFKLDTKFIFNTTTTASYESRYDINNDGRIDDLDLMLLSKALGSSRGDLNYLAAADFNNDGMVNQQDLDLFSKYFGAVAIGQPDYTDATSARLAALLVADSQNYLNKLSVVRAVSRAPDAVAPNGRTVLFLSDSTPVPSTGIYDVSFGFSAAMYLGYTQTSIETVRPLSGSINLNNVSMFESINKSNTRTVTQLQAQTVANQNNKYTSTIYFTPAVATTGTFSVQSQWSPQGLVVRPMTDLVISQKYEQLDRKVYGPFKLNYTNLDYAQDGTSIAFTLKAIDATLADGSPDPSGTHINGIPLSDLYFTIHLTIISSNNEAQIWTWHQIKPLGVDNKIKLEYNSNLFIDHRNQGKNKTEVLTPFGTAQNQVNLQPMFAGGDLLNDLQNISVIRSDSLSPYIIPHTHSNDRDGGLLTSKDIQFADDLARLELINPNMTDAVYKLLDIIAEQQRQIALIQALQGVMRYDSNYYWDDPTVYWDSTSTTK